jgi:hypothetical protein
VRVRARVAVFAVNLFMIALVMPAQGAHLVVEPEALLKKGLKLLAAGRATALVVTPPEGHGVH